MFLQVEVIARSDVDKCEQELCLPATLNTWRVRVRNKNRKYSSEDWARAINTVLRILV